MTSSAPAHFGEISSFLKANPDSASTRPADLSRLLESFVAGNEDPQRSPNLRERGADGFEPLVRLLGERPLEAFPELLALAVRAIKIITRKADNRARFLPAHIKAIVARLERPINNKIASEAANCILNVCYERQNVDICLDVGAVPPLVGFISSKDLGKTIF
jgi:hypothetical protein